MSHVRKQGLIARNIEGELVILDRQAGFVHQLNTTASCIWDACDGVRSPAEIADCVAGTFENPPDAARLLQDVHAALAEFRRLGLLLDGHCAGMSESEPITEGS